MLQASVWCRVLLTMSTRCAVIRPPYHGYPVPSALDPSRRHLLFPSLNCGRPMCSPCCGDVLTFYSDRLGRALQIRPVKKTSWISLLYSLCRCSNNILTTRRDICKHLVNTWSVLQIYSCAVRTDAPTQNRSTPYVAQALGLSP